MVFSDLFFLFIFIPAFMLCYLLAAFVDNRLLSTETERSNNARNSMLVIFSLVFYAWGEPVYVFLMLACVFINYLSGLVINSCEGGKRRAALTVGLICNIAILGTFKYLGFFAATLGDMGIDVSVPAISLPIGISFYTFQSISYLIDVYRKESPVQRRFTGLLLYISMFPQLIAGPIVRYGTVADEIHNRRVSADDFADGAYRFLIGLGKKVIIANQLSEIADQFLVNGLGHLSTTGAWIGITAFTLQIYFDFSGYSDMAIGMGRCLGFHFNENFNHPYCCKSITDFWRRWHISLSSWVRDYLFLPLSSFIRRWGQWGVAASLMVTFIALGVWHGAGWTFAVYGFIQGLVIVWELRTERIRNKVRKHIGGRLFATLSVIRTYLIFAVSLVFFKAQSVSDAFYFLRNISFQTHASWKEINIGMSDHICIVAGAALLLMLLYDYLMSKRNQHRRLERQPILLRWTIYYLIVFALFAYGKFGTENFIYLQF